MKRGAFFRGAESLLLRDKIRPPHGQNPPLFEVRRRSAGLFRRFKIGKKRPFSSVAVSLDGRLTAA
jgi:hypothetical protein